MIGKRIGGRYEVIRGIGEGGMSKVYLAHDIILDRDVAIKVLNYDFTNEEDLKRRFQREAQSATSLTHPHIVNIYDVGEDGELHYFVMEYIEGQTLKKFIQTNGPLPASQAIKIMRQLVSAIANAHHNGIIHRDIKPQNILMDAEGNVKITDFGIAMALSATAHTKTNSVIGTVHYLSPEQARGGMATKKSDIYSLGIVFYELLTGELPFSAETAVAIALKHLQEETPSVRLLYPSIPQSVENVILKATSKDATYRYRSADEMYDDLFTVLTPERAHEEKFTVPFDDDRTRVIPAITDTQKTDPSDTTKIMEPVIPEKIAPPTKKKRKKWPIVFGVMAGLLVIILLALFLPSLFGPKEVLVPDVIGYEEATAVNTLTNAGLIVKERIEDFSDEYEKGKVFQTDPEADKKLEEGSAVTIYVSKGKETIELTDFTGRDYDDEFVAFLTDLGFASVTSEPIYSDEPEGRILEQSPALGEEVVPEETDLIFTVSAGREKITLDNLTGYNKNQLDAYGDKHGLNIVAVREEYNDEIPAGQVISQKPSAHSEVEKGARIEVALSKGQEKKPVKKVEKELEIQYEYTNSEDEEDGVEPKPQTIKIYVQDNKYSMTDPVSEFILQENEKRKITIELELEEGQRGAYRVFRDNSVFKEETIDYDDID